MQLANQNLLQYSDLDGLQDFNQYINRNIFMIFGNSGSFEKGYEMQVKYNLISDVLNKKNPSAKPFTVSKFLTSIRVGISS